MNKLSAVLIAVGILAGCSELSTLVPSSDKTPLTTQGQLNSCMLTEANDRLQAGTLFTSGLGIRETAKDIAGVCIKKLALQKAGLDTQAVTQATNILNSLKAAQ